MRKIQFLFNPGDKPTNKLTNKQMQMNHAGGVDNVSMLAVAPKWPEKLCHGAAKYSNINNV